MEFALAWPVALLLILGAVQLSLWGIESFAARSAALAGARAATVAGAGPRTAMDVAARALRPTSFGAEVVESCLPDGTAGQVQVCALDLGQAVEVEIDGEVPLLVPLLGGRPLPVHARIVLQKELYSR